MTNLLVSWFGTSWRTTLTGYIGAILTAIMPLLTSATHTFNIRTDWPYLLAAAGVAIFSANTKDKQVSGKPDGTYNAGLTVNQALADAQIALGIAKSTHNENLIKLAQATVDDLEKQAPKPEPVVQQG